MKTSKQPKNAWNETQDALADKNGVAVIVVDENSTVVRESNNNSICKMLYSSEEFAPECDRFCGQAFKMASQAEKAVDYQCYAGLDCRAVPIKKGEKTNFVAIVGRAFTKAEHYRNATERAISGDWKQFPPTKFFENVLLKGSTKSLETASKSIENLRDEEKIALEKFVDKEQGEEIKEISQTDELSKLVEQFHNATAQTAIVSEKITRKTSEEAEEFAAWRSLFGSLLKLSYQQACLSILEFVAKRYALDSVAWLERKENRLEAIFAVGKLKNQLLNVRVAADSERLKDAVEKETSLELRQRKNKESDKSPTIRLFPIAVGGEIRCGLVLGDEAVSQNTQRHIARFCQNIASELEILRLREKLARSDLLEIALQKFNANLSEIDTEDFWSRLTQISAELLRAERSSLLLFDEKSDVLTVKAAIGNNADTIKRESANIGVRVARPVLDDGKSLVVANVDKIGLQAAPLEWKYKSKSFISYPLKIGTRKIGVLNLTDKTDGEIYSEFDLELLHAIVPQLAVLIDRAVLKHKAGEFEQLSVTDALTGLLNRRYLEERLAEEIKRSNRHGFPMSFMMIDVDNFKTYNDNFSHPEGDTALQLVAHCLKDTLRGADVAARYGGEEFSILLPQTNSLEAETIAERIRQRVESTPFPNRQVTISIGVASCSKIICDAKEIVATADKALYEAKRKGRNNVQVYEKLEMNNTTEINYLQG